MSARRRFAARIICERFLRAAPVGSFLAFMTQDGEWLAFPIIWVKVREDRWVPRWWTSNGASDHHTAAVVAAEVVDGETVELERGSTQPERRAAEQPSDDGGQDVNARTARNAPASSSQTAPPGKPQERASDPHDAPEGHPTKPTTNPTRESP